MFSLLMLFYVVTIYHSIVMRGLRYSSHLPNCLHLRRIPFASIIFRLHIRQFQRNILGSFLHIRISPVPSATSTSFVSLLIEARWVTLYCFVITVLLSTNRIDNVSKLPVSSVAFDVIPGVPSVRKEPDKIPSVRGILVKGFFCEVH